MAEYVVLLIGDTEHWWTGANEEEKAAAMAAHGTFTDQLAERGHTITGGAELHRAGRARTIAPHATSATDGPWAESAEQVGGYYVIESSDLDDLLECCTILAATGDAVEGRECVDQEEVESA
ncbi:YciI family protein [Nocardioides currus]|uniref:Transcription initiation protein n=1 Tax=Nocardioides currus TaxID=2133958 RepID=A0A2R7YRY2_9ACTN|nr:YciI family protein [Nocardioides currus]PUA79142.1 transcription initiation protein [Nocardioides currus]